MKIRLRLFLTFLLPVLSLLAIGLALGAQEEALASHQSLAVMTRNIYFGVDPTPLLLMTDCSNFAAAATVTYQEALDSDFPARAAAIAAEIQQTAPDLVGIQEGVVWSETWPGGQTIDFVQLITGELANAGAGYTPVAVASGLDVNFPTTLGGEVRLQVNDVLLARDEANLALTNVMTGTYAGKLVLPTCIGFVNLPRQWASADVEMGEGTVRVITTHLEAALRAVRTAQANELLAGPASSDLPTVVMGDINSESEADGDAAALILAAGYTDTWPSPGTGDTCCQASDLRNPMSLLDERIDLVLTRNGLQATSAGRVGASPLSPPPPSGVLWASDHAGVGTTLTIRDDAAVAVFLPAIRRAPAVVPDSRN